MHCRLYWAVVLHLDKKILLLYDIAYCLYCLCCTCLRVKERCTDTTQHIFRQVLTLQVYKLVINRFKIRSSENVIIN